MRLIDADATVQEIRRIEKIAEKQVKNTNPVNRVYQRYVGEWHAIRRMRMLVDRAPTAYDVEEIAKKIYIHGKQAGEAANIFDDEYAHGQMMAYYDSEKIVRYGMEHLTKLEESPDGKRLREREEFFEEE